MVHLGERVQVGAAVRVHDALRAARRAAGVVDADGVVLGDKPRLGVALGGRGEQLLVLVAGEDRAHAGALGQVREGGVGDQQRGAGVPEDVGDLVRHQPRVDGDQHPARPGHAEVRLQDLGRVRAEHRDPIAVADALLLEGHRQPA